jgi:hypothetical protein
MATSLYFFVTYSRKQKENNDVEFVVPEKNNLKPVCIYEDLKYEGQRFHYNKIFAVEKPKKSKKNFNFVFEIGDEQYVISFDYSKGSSFIYDVNLDFGKKIIDIRRKISQTKEYQEKMDVFIKALEKNNEAQMIKELYKDTIELYSKKKIFSFLIVLFLKVYEDKDLCKELLNSFRKMNEDPKNIGKNMDR